MDGPRLAEHARLRARPSKPLRPGTALLQLVSTRSRWGVWLSLMLSSGRVHHERSRAWDWLLSRVDWENWRVALERWDLLRVEECATAGWLLLALPAIG